MPDEVIARNHIIIKYSIAGLLMNLLLAVSKMIAGTLAHSYAIVLDGINSLSDLLSAGISILSTFFGAKKADASHPFGYGRMEYLSSMAITMLIMYIGVRSIINSVKSIIAPPAAPHYDLLIILIMVLSLAAKAVYGFVTRRKGKQIHSISMIMSGTDSIVDGLISASILAAIAVYRFTGVNIEHYLCVGISLLILYTAVRMIIESMTKILGTRTDPAFRKRIISLFIEEEEVLNVSNLILHNYGENIYVGSADIEVDEQMKAGEISRLSRHLIRKAKDYGVTITSIGISGANVVDPEADRMWETIVKTALDYDSIVRVHSFNVDFEAKELSFYVVQDFAGTEQERELRELQSVMSSCFPDMQIEINTALNA